MLDAFDVAARVIECNRFILSLDLILYLEGPNWSQRACQLDEAVSVKALEGTMQDRYPRQTIRLLRDSASGQNLRSIIGRMSVGQLVGLVSKVKLVDGSHAHIPMMDFACAVSSENTNLLSVLLGKLNLGRGFLLNSGRSYHYYGTQLLSEDTWPAFLGKCLLMSGYCDDRYIGHQLVDGHCVLRLSRGMLKENLPTLVAEFE